VNFILSYLFSFIGSLTPGTINLSAVQLGLERKAHIVWRLALAAAVMEYIYAWLAVRFEDFITSTPLVIANFQLLAAIVMFILGALTLWSAAKPSKFSEKFSNSGFRRGLILGILNPLAMPFWIGVTAYLKSQHWIDLSTFFGLHLYLLGVSAGVFTLLMLVGYLAKKAITVVQHRSPLLRKIPGFAMLLLGVYALLRYWVNSSA
jgi:threonine/homoserine/homoserine lactone efflux protein